MIAYMHVEEKTYWGDYDFNAMNQRQIEQFAEQIKIYAETGRWNESF
jgi:hypothetical protein